MSLEEKLAAIREMAKTRQPPEVRAVMHRAVEDLRASGIMDRVAKVGSTPVLNAVSFFLMVGSGLLVLISAIVQRDREPN